MKLLSIGILTTVAMLPVPGFAQEVTLGREAADNVFVWKDSDAQSEAFKLISSGVHKTNPVLVMRLLSCMVPGGTKAIIKMPGSHPARS